MTHKVEKETTSDGSEIKEECFLLAQSLMSIFH